MPRPDNHLRSVPTPPPSPLPDKPVTASHRTYPAESALVAGAAAFVVDLAATAFLPPSAGSGAWMAMVGVLSAAVGVPIYRGMLRRVRARGVVLPSLLDSINSVLGAGLENSPDGPDIE